MLNPSLLAVAFGLGAIAAAIVIPLLIAWQRRRQLGQEIYADGPTTHAVKQGTPTMGGLAFVAALIVCSLVPLPRSYFDADIPLLLLVLAAALIGFADDYLKLIRRRPLGLRARAKFGLLVVVAIAYVAWEAHDMHFMSLWFTGFVPLPGWLWGLLALGAIVGAANAVNLTDGLDGLAAGSAIPPLLFFGLISAGRAAELSVGVVGACVGFLFYNRHPARIFMGDTGSLALGALLGGLAVENNMLLLLPIIGIVFVVEALSVMLQVLSFQTTGKRIFKMSPLHHHFELSGWREQRVTAAFVVTSSIASIATLTWFVMYIVRVGSG